MVKKIGRFLWIQVLICASVYGFYQWREYEHAAIEAHAIAADMRSFEFIEIVSVNEANWRYERGEAYLRLIQHIVEDAVTGLVNDEEPLQRLKRETR